MQPISHPALNAPEGPEGRSPGLNRRELHRHRLVNLLQTTFYLTAIVGLLGAFAYFLFGLPGLWACIWFVVLFFLVGVRLSPHFVLNLHQAKELGRQEAPALFSLATNLAKQAAISSQIRLFCTPGKLLNAFSTGTKDEPCIALSEGLLQALDRRELAGVIAHELAHLANGDIKIMVLSHMVGKATSFFAVLGQVVVWLNLPFILTGDLKLPLWFFFLIGVGPTLMQLIHLKISRLREYNADVLAVKMTEDPEGLASALAKIGSLHRKLLLQVLSPYHEEALDPPEWLSTHPATGERIKKIQRMINSQNKGQGFAKTNFRK